MKVKKKGLLLVLSGPSGAGKGTVCRALLKDQPSLRLSVSATTRPPRQGEVDGVDYFFLDNEVFQNLIKEGSFWKYAEVYSNYYGTPLRFVMTAVGRLRYHIGNRYPGRPAGEGKVSYGSADFYCAAVQA
jgi:guanylate kinase